MPSIPQGSCTAAAAAVPPPLALPPPLPLHLPCLLCTHPLCCCLPRHSFLPQQLVITTYVLLALIADESIPVRMAFGVA